MGGQIKAWLQLVRPFTLVAPFIAIFFGVIIQLAVYGNLASFWPNIPTIVFAALALSAAQAVGAVGQILNQVEDVEIDILNHKDYRPIPSGKITVAQAETASWALAIFSILVGFAVNIYYGVFMMTFILFGILYNLEPFRVKKRLWINTISLSISRGLFPLPAAVWVLAWQNTKDLDDVEGDRDCGIMTPVVYHRWKTLTSIIGFLSLVTFALLALYIVSGWLPSSMAILFILALPTAWMFYKMARNNISATSLENNELWASFYLTLAGFYIVAAAAYLVGPYLTLFS